MNERSLNASLKQTTASIEQLYTNEQLRDMRSPPLWQTNSKFKRNCSVSVDIYSPLKLARSQS